MSKKKIGCIVLGVIALLGLYVVVQIQFTEQRRAASAVIREQAYDQGYQAWKEGLPITANPYDRPDAKQGWHNGWSAANRE